MMPLFFPNYTTDYSHVRWSEAGARMRIEVRAIVGASNTLKLLTSLAFNYSPSNGSPPFSDLDPADVLERAKNSDPLAFRENLEVLANEVQRNGSRLFLVGFLQAERDNLTRNRPDLIGLEDAAILLVQKHDQIMKEISDRYDHVDFLKLDQSKFNPDWFIDNCHLNEFGEIEKARQVSQFLLSKLDK